MRPRVNRLTQGARARAFEVEGLESRICMDAMPVIPTGSIQSKDVDPLSLDGEQSKVVRADLNGDGLEDIAIARGRALTIKLRALVTTFESARGVPTFLLSQQFLLPGRHHEVLRGNTGVGDVGHPAGELVVVVGDLTGVHSVENPDLLRSHADNGIGSGGEAAVLGDGETQTT